MVERIGTASTMQAKAVQSVKSAEDIKPRNVSEKGQPSIQTDESRKRDRFEYSGTVLNSGSPDDLKADKSFDEKQNAAQSNKPRSFDRLEFSGEYLSGSFAKSEDGVKTRDISETNLSAIQPEKVQKNNSEEVASNDNNSSIQNYLTESSSESVDTNRLYQYTDTELKDFLLDGSITQSEYNAELAKREG